MEEVDALSKVYTVICVVSVERWFCVLGDAKNVNEVGCWWNEVIYLIGGHAIICSLHLSTVAMQSYHCIQLCIHVCGMHQHPASTDSQTVRRLMTIVGGNLRVQVLVMVSGHPSGWELFGFMLCGSYLSVCIRSVERQRCIRINEC